MKKPRTQRLLLVSASIVLIYILFLTWFALSLYSIAKSTKQNFYNFKNVGYTVEVKEEYLKQLKKIDNLHKISKTPLIYPLLKLNSRSNEILIFESIYEDLKPIFEVLPTFAGGDKEKRYLIAFQNPAEARGTGGIIGAFATLNLEKGKFTIENVGSNSMLQSAPDLPIKLPREYSNIYRTDPAIWQNSNMSPHFPYGAKIWLSLWEKQYSQKLDGVITLDPIVLQSILAVIGPIDVEGQTIDSNNVVRKTLSDVYLEFEKNNENRKQFLVSVIQGVSKKLLSSKLDVYRLILNLQDPIFEQRILVFSNNPEIENRILKTKIGGSLLLKANNNYRVVIQNVSGNKMDYYLSRSIKIKSIKCGVSGKTLVTFRVKNIVSKNLYLPDYVKGRLDLGLTNGKNNSTGITIFIYGPKNKKIIYASEVGKSESTGFIKTELKRQAFVIPVELAAGESKTFNVMFENGKGPITTNIQPLVRPQITKILDNCS